MGSNRLHIRRFHAHYLAPHDHPAPQRLKGRIDDAVAQHLLAQTLSHALANLFSETDESVWLIRRLELDLAVNAAWDREQLTRVIAAQLARMLAGALNETGDGNVVRFANRAAHLARFLTDVTAGRAWGKWYYESFAGLRPLSTSATLRTAICNEPDAGQAALLQLNNYELKQLLSALTDQDARRILDHLAANPGAGDVVRCCEAVWLASREIERETFNSAEWSKILHLFLITIRQHEDVGGAALKKSAVALLQLRRIVVQSSPDQMQQLLAALTNGSLASLHLAVGTAQADSLAPLLLCPSAWVTEVIETLMAQQKGFTRNETDEGERRVTSFGGLFVLLPLVDELPLAEATRSWPPAADTAAVELVRYLLLVKSIGQKYAHNAFYDPLWRDLLLIPPAISPPVLLEWSEQITTAQVRSFLETLVDWQRSRGAVQDQLQILALTKRGAESIAILIDGARGNWLTVKAYAEDQPRALGALLGNFLAQLDGDSGILFCEPALLPALWAEFPAVRMIGLEDDEVPAAVADQTNQLAAIRARLGKLSDDLFHLTLPDSLRLAPELDSALTVAAQNLLRSFSWRLPGFASSSLPYLNTNFLDLAGSVEEEPERRVVRLGRPLLHLVANLTGMSRQTYRLSWLDERPLSLFPED